MNDKKKLLLLSSSLEASLVAQEAKESPTNSSSPWAMKASTRISFCAAFSNALRSFASELQPP